MKKISPQLLICKPKDAQTDMTCLNIETIDQIFDSESTHDKENNHD